MALLIHLPRRTEWNGRTCQGLYRPRSLVEEGFIHLCRWEDAVMVANLLFTHVDDLLTVGIDSRRLGPELRLQAEKPGGFAWPHLHGPLNLDAVVLVRPFPRRPDGRYMRLPAEFRHLDCGPPLRFHDEMTAAEAIGVLDLLGAAGINPVVDGGWAVDAILGRQSRHHGDLDICLDREDVDRAVKAMRARGYAVTEDGRPTRLELRSRGGFGPQVDIHPLLLDELGNGTQDLRNGSMFTYPAAGLAGAGVIGHREVRCLTPDLQLACHRGYEPDEDDYDDVVALAALLGVEPLPPFDR